MSFAAKYIIGFAICTLCSAANASPTVERIDSDHVYVELSGANDKQLLVSSDPVADAGDSAAVIVARKPEGVVVEAPASRRLYFIVKGDEDAKQTIVSERLLPLERGSNFRDLGGYEAAEGKHVAWGRLYRSGALPMLSENDYTYLEPLGISAIVDLRSTDERQVAPDLLDDRLGALFVSNDYPIAPLLEGFRNRGDRPLYAGTERRLIPQLRSLFKLLLRDDGAVMFHCSAGQDRTGIAAALILAALGVDRETIVADYHLSTPSRRPEHEMPELDPTAFPGNPIVQIYAAQRAKHGELKAEPLYMPDGRSHIRMFLDYMDSQYGGAENFLKSELGIGPAEVARLRALYLV